MVPRTSHGVVDHQSLGERPAVVRAGRADREEFIAAAREEDWLLAHMSAEHASIGEVIERDSFREIGTRRIRLLCAHGGLLTSSEILGLDDCSAQSMNTDLKKRNAGVEKMFPWWVGAAGGYFACSPLVSTARAHA